MFNGFLGLFLFYMFFLFLFYLLFIFLDSRRLASSWVATIQRSSVRPRGSRPSETRPESSFRRMPIIESGGVREH